MKASAVLLELELIDAEDADNQKNPYGLINTTVEYDADVVNSLRKAADDLERAISIDPSLEGAYYRLGVARAALGATGAAVEAFQKTMELEPERTAVYFHIAELYWKDSRFDNALKVADAFLLRFPDERLDALLIAGATYFKKGDFEAAASRAMEMLLLDSENIDGLLLLGASRYAGGNTIKAEEAFSTARRIDPDIARHVMEIKWGVDRGIYGKPATQAR